MKYHHLVLLCIAFVSIFFTRVSCSEKKVHVFTDLHADPTTIHFSPKHTVELHCNTTESGEITWEKNSKPVTGVGDLKDRITITNNTLVLKDTKEADVGNYSCVVTTASGKFKDTVGLATASSAKWGVRVAKYVNVVEGEKLTLKCEVRGELKLEWWYENTTSGENFTRLPGPLERVRLTSYYDEDLKANVTDGELKIDEIQMSDRGNYLCLGLAEDGERFNMSSTIRIKDKYAALWPFLGICVEVFVLCAIIFIYEKKRNKTELEESDTDQSPDQKNTPDHGKESNLRHRQ